jgi:type II secretory pathway pseudopilin PulG
MKIVFRLTALVVVCIVIGIAFEVTRPNPVKYGVYNRAANTQLQIWTLKSAVQSYISENDLRTFPSDFNRVLLSNKGTSEFFSSNGGLHLVNGQLVDGDGISYSIEVLSSKQLKISASDGQSEMINMP